MQSEIFETQRLLLRPLSIEDVQLVLRLNSDPVVMEHIGPVNTSVEKAREYVELRVNQYADLSGMGLFVASLKSSGEQIGWFCLKKLDDTEKIEVGYRLLKDYWGQGLATEGAHFLVKMGFEHLNLDEIFGVTAPGNTASQRVLEKIGLFFIGKDRFYGTEVDCYKISASDVN